MMSNTGSVPRKFFRFQTGLAFLIAGLLIFCSSVFSAAIAAETPSALTIMHTNDLHSHLLGFGPNSEYTPLITGDDDTVGGFARIAGKVDEIRTAHDGINPVLLVDAGDFMMGTGFVLLRGAAELSLMDALGYDCITLGNHEFDWTPDGTAQILSNIIYPSPGLNLPVVASNLIFDDVHTGDDNLKDLFDAGVIQPYYIKDLGYDWNNYRIGFFGLVGKDADSVAPFAYPITFRDQAETAQDMVDALDGIVDLIVCLSHSGLEEDTALAAAVSGIDVIISGHTHETTTAPIVENGTIIVQTGSYGRNLGVLDLDISAGVSWSDFELVPINDDILGDSAIDAVVGSLVADLDDILDPMGYAFQGVIAETAFDLTQSAGVEGNLGNLVTDAMSWMVDQYETDHLVDFAFESAGVIRDNIDMGSSGQIAFSDAFRVIPLGFGLDGAVGYPMVTIYVTAAEVKKALEVLTTVYPLEGSDYWLSVSGLKVEYNPNLIPFFRVLRVWVPDGEGGWCKLDTSFLNKNLYKIAINYYVAQFIAVVGDYTYGILTIDPKDASGVSYLDETAHPDGLDEARVDIDPGTAGIQELQQWVGFVDYLEQFDDAGSNGIPDIPASYAGPEGRITETNCFISTASL